MRRRDRRLSIGGGGSNGASGSSRAPAFPGVQPSPKVSKTSLTTGCSTSTPTVSMNLFRNPIITTLSAIHSARFSPYASIIAALSVARSWPGTAASDRATAIAASSPDSNELRSGSSAVATFSGSAPRRRAKEHEWAEQYGDAAVRLATYIAKPTTDGGGPPNPSNGTGRFSRFGTITL